MYNTLQVNGEAQKRAEDMLGEVAITQTLSSLANPEGKEAHPTYTCVLHVCSLFC